MTVKKVVMEAVGALKLMLEIAAALHTVALELVVNNVHGLVSVFSGPQLVYVPSK